MWGRKYLFCLRDGFSISLRIVRLNLIFFVLWLSEWNWSVIVFIVISYCLRFVFFSVRVEIVMC